MVNIRDEKDLSVKNGCSVWDMGYKIGLNGVDNAALWFNKVRVPRVNLLNSTSDMDENGLIKIYFFYFHISFLNLLYSKGVYSSKIQDKSARRRKRFIVLADQLLSGRVCIAAMTMGSIKLILDETVIIY